MTQKTLLQSSGDGTAVPAGYVGQLLQNAGGEIEASFGPSNQIAAIASFNLTAGTWLCFGANSFIKNADSYTATDVFVFLSGVSGTSTSGVKLGYNKSIFLPSATAANFTLTLQPQIVYCDGSNLTIAGTTTVGTTLYLKHMAPGLTTGQARYSVSLTAIRIA
jgi:hypothetical protein